MIEIFNGPWSKDDLISAGIILLAIGVIMWAVWSLFVRIRDRDSSIISQYREKRDPQIEKIIRAIIETCRLYTHDAPYVSSYFAEKINVDIKNDQIMVPGVYVNGGLNPHITIMIEVVKEACLQKDGAMKDIDTSVSLIYESYGIEFDKVGKRTHAFFKKSSQMIDKLRRTEERLRDGLDSLKKVEDVKE